MKIILPKSVDKYLSKQFKGDPKNIHLIRLFLDTKLATAENPTQLSNCKKLQGYEKHYRWKVKDYRIIGIVENDILTIEIIKITTRENAYQ